MMFEIVTYYTFTGRDGGAPVILLVMRREKSFRDTL